MGGERGEGSHGEKGAALMDGGRCSASRGCDWGTGSGQPSDPAGPEAPVSSVLMAGGFWVSSRVPGEEE